MLRSTNAIPHKFVLQKQYQLCSRGTRSCSLLKLILKKGTACLYSLTPPILRIINFANQLKKTANHSRPSPPPVVKTYPPGLNGHHKKRIFIIIKNIVKQKPPVIPVISLLSGCLGLISQFCNRLKNSYPIVPIQPLALFVTPKSYITWI